MITLLILLCIFVIVMAFQVAGMIALSVVVLALLIFGFLINKLSDWIDHKRFKRKLDRM